MPEPTTDIYRNQALEHHRLGRGLSGDPLRLSPAWPSRTYALLLAVTIAGIAYLMLGRISEFATGPIVIHAGGRVEVTSHVAATVDAVLVDPGEEVAAGQILVQLDAANERAELEQIQAEYESKLVARLRHPDSSPTDRELVTLRTRLELASRRLSARAIRSPADGVVADLRTRPGEYLSPGETAMTLARPGGEFFIAVFLPGRYRPQLAPGQEMRFEVAGFPRAYQTALIESVDEEVIGPSEARRTLGPLIGDAVPLTGPVVLVRASLPASSFDADGESYAYHEGLHGTADVKLRAEPLLFALAPGLRALKDRAR